MTDLDNVFTSATEEELKNQITLSAFSRPEKYIRQDNVRTPNPSNRHNQLSKLLEARKNLNERFTPKRDLDDTMNKRNLQEFEALKVALAKNEIGIPIKTIEKAMYLPSYICEDAAFRNHE